MFAVIFDMDGVIVDSGPYHVKAWSVLCQKYGLEFDETDFKSKMFGKSTPITLEYMFQRKLSDEEIEKYAKEKDDLTIKAYEEGVTAQKGVIELLNSLKDRQITRAVATSEPEELARFLLKRTNVSKYFNVVISGSKVTKLKPDPEIYLLTAKEISFEPNNCIAIEDSVVGVQSAKAAGMKVIAITTSFPKEKLQEADLIIDSFDELDVEKLLILSN